MRARDADPSAESGKSTTPAAALDAAKRTALDGILQHARRHRHAGANDRFAERGPKTIAARARPGLFLFSRRVLGLRGLGLAALCHALLQDLVGRFAILDLVILSAHRARVYDGLALGIADRTDPRIRRLHQGALDHGRLALLVERRDQRFADAELHDGLLGIDLRILAEGLRRRSHCFLLRRREGGAESSEI